ncbi:MAG TPA: hypothetical protein VGO03_04590 [Acidimicrobiia bacterium]|jgi:hypothetical protein
MRKTILTVLSAAALALPVFAFAGSPASAAAAGTSCTTTTGKATFNPPLPKLGSTQTVKGTIKSTGTTKGCTGGGVKSGTITGTFKSSKAGNCQTLVSGGSGASTGTINIKWNTGKTSSGPATIKQVSGHSTEATVAGTVTAGLFKGLHSSVTVTFATSTAGGDCVHSNLKYVTFKNNTKLLVH